MVGAFMLVVVKRVPVLNQARTCENSIPSHLKAKQVKYVAYVAHLPNFTFVGRIEASGRCQGVGLFTRWFDSKQEKPKATTHTLYEEKNGLEMWHGKFNQNTEKFVVRCGDEPN